MVVLFVRDVTLMRSVVVMRVVMVARFILILRFDEVMGLCFRRIFAFDIERLIVADVMGR